jgi:adenosine deaminase
MDNSLRELIKAIPKAELHLHLEGTFEPELMFEIAQRNKIQLPYKDVDEIRKAYQFNNLQEFLDIYYAGANVLLYERDFFDLTWAYLSKVHGQSVKHVEVFFDPQTHTERGVPFDVVVNGIYTALLQGEKEYGISFKLIMSFLKHLDEESAFETLGQGLLHKDKIDGIGLDSTELGNPPQKFERVVAWARTEGFPITCHAGEEGPAEFVRDTLDLLKVVRIDHGNNSLDDDDLVKELAERQIPLTLCPLSNLALKVVERLEDYPLLEMMDKGMLVTLNSDDPAYFGGYINENYIQTATALNLNTEQIVQLAKNSFIASWLDDASKNRMIDEIDRKFK